MLIKKAQNYFTKILYINKINKYSFNDTLKTISNLDNLTKIEINHNNDKIKSTNNNNIISYTSSSIREKYKQLYFQNKSKLITKELCFDNGSKKKSKEINNIIQSKNQLNISNQTNNIDNDSINKINQFLKSFYDAIELIKELKISNQYHLNNRIIKFIKHKFSYSQFEKLINLVENVLIVPNKSKYKLGYYILLAELFSISNKDIFDLSEKLFSIDTYPEIVSYILDDVAYNKIDINSKLKLLNYTSYLNSKINYTDTKNIPIKFDILNKTKEILNDIHFNINDNNIDNINLSRLPNTQSNQSNYLMYSSILLKLIKEDHYKYLEIFLSYIDNLKYKKINNLNLILSLIRIYNEIFRLETNSINSSNNTNTTLRDNLHLLIKKLKHAEVPYNYSYFIIILKIIKVYAELLSNIKTYNLHLFPTIFDLLQIYFFAFKYVVENKNINLSERVLISNIFNYVLDKEILNEIIVNNKFDYNSYVIELHNEVINMKKFNKTNNDNNQDCLVNNCNLKGENKMLLDNYEKLLDSLVISSNDPFKFINMKYECRI